MSEAEGDAGAPAAADVPVTESAPASWTESLGEDAQGYVENKGWSGPDQMLDSYRNLEKSMGVPADRVVHIPTEDDTSGWSDLYGRMGRPATPDEYQLQSDIVPEGAIDLTADLRGWAHEAGLSQKQTELVYAKYNGRLSELVQEQSQQAAEASQADEAALKKEWGNAWEENVAAAKKFRQQFDIDDATLSKMESAMGLRGVMELSARVGRSLGEHTMPTGSEEDSGRDLSFGMTPAAARAKIEEMQLDTEFMDQYMQGRPQAVARMTRLHSLAHPDAPQGP